MDGVVASISATAVDIVVCGVLASISATAIDILYNSG